VLYSVLLTGSVVLIIELLDTHAFAPFLPASSAALAIASHLNRIVTWSYVFFGVAMVLFGVVRATGAVMAPLLVLAVTLLVVRFPLAMFFLDSYHADAIWWSFPVSSALAAVLAILYYNYGGWRAAHMMPVEAHMATRSSEAPAAPSSEPPIGAPAFEDPIAAPASESAIVVPSSELPGPETAG
jgi:hypothetical protein